MSELLLPLFPLHLVLFPRVVLPLHIFEERYKQMVAECLEKKEEFGVVLAQENSLETTGCTATISEVVRQYEDGRLDILARGGRRFEILLLDREKAYLRGAPHFFEDDVEAGAVSGEDERRQQALRLYEEVLGMLEGETPDAPDARDEQLSYQIMGRLPVDLSFKQSLLESRSESERLTKVVSYLQKVVKKLALATKARAQAGGNGHGR